MNIQEAVKIAYEHDKWIKRKGIGCSIKPTNKNDVCCLLRVDRNYPENKRKPSKYWNPKYEDLISEDWYVRD